MSEVQPDRPAAASSWEPRRLAVPGLLDPAPLAYSQCVVVGPLVFVAGQMGVDADGKIVPGGFEPQLRKAFDNVSVALAEAGTSLDRVVLMTTYLTDLRHSAELVRIRREYLAAAAPAGALVGVSQLPWPEVTVSLQMIAVLPG